MFHLLIQLLNPLLVFALICVLIFELRRLRDAQDAESKRLLRAVATLVPDVPSQDERTDNDRFSGKLELTKQQLAHVIDEAQHEIAERLREYQILLAKNQEGFEAFLDRFARQQVALEKLVEALSRDKQPELFQSAETSPTEAARNDGAFLRAASDNRKPAATLAQTHDKAGDSKERFESLARWVHANMESVMQRCLNARGQPDTIIVDAPAELGATAQIADGIVLLIGSRDYPEKLALVLPGSYIGARYYNWFDIPIGTNERVEDTVEPALIQQVGEEFVVLKRGAVRQN